jgi:hypothetical protein
MKPDLGVNQNQLRQKLISLERIDLFDKGFEFFESLFLKTSSMKSEIQYAEIQSSEFPKGYGLLSTDKGIRSSKRRYDLKDLLRYVGLDIKNFTKIYRVLSGYDLIIYGYSEDGKKEFLVIGKRIKEGASLYYQQSTLDNTKNQFHEIQEWFNTQESSHE